MLKFAFVLLFFFSFNSHAQIGQIGVKSFYYVSGDSTLTANSGDQLEELIVKQKTHNLQVIELNSYANSSQDSKVNRDISANRAKDFLTKLKLEQEQINIGIYGSRKIPLNFKPDNWNRIDIYYIFTIKAGSTLSSIPDSEIVVITPIIDTIPKAEEYIDSKPDEILKEVPITTPIQFIGGKTRISDSSQEFIDSLTRTMEEHPELSAHIRGHVCCGAYQRVSKKRAKNVYKALVRRGISKKRLSYAGYSNNLPIVFPEVNERDRKKNRRVDIIFSDK